jgi:hypothetical protein
MGKLVTIIAYKMDGGRVYAGIPNGNDEKGNRKLKHGIFMKAEELNGVSEEQYIARITEKYKEGEKGDRTVKLGEIVSARNLTFMLD